VAPLTLILTPTLPEGRMRRRRKQVKGLELAPHHLGCSGIPDQPRMGC
jgi:hypothetical protein